MRRIIVALLIALGWPAYGYPSDFSLTDMQGNTHTLGNYRGKWIVVNLWATWCAPCIVEMPELQALSQSNPDLVVLGLAVDGENEQRVKQFVERLKITYPIVAAGPEKIKPFSPKGFPTTIVYSPSGLQVMIREGPITAKEIEQLIRQKS